MYNNGYQPTKPISTQPPNRGTSVQQSCRGNAMTYKLYKYVDGEWYIWGNYKDPVSLAHASNELGWLGLEIKVEVVENGMDKR